MQLCPSEGVKAARMVGRAVEDRPIRSDFGIIPYKKFLRSVHEIIMYKVYNFISSFRPMICVYEGISGWVGHSAGRS